MKISVYIIAYNESEKIRDCINSVLWADEIIVADSYSTDGTSEITQFGGRSATAKSTQSGLENVSIINQEDGYQNAIVLGV